MGLTGAALAIAFLTGAVLPDESPLLDATKRGDVQAVRSLLAEGADPNAAQGDGLTALHVAAQEGYLEIAEALLGAGADVEAKTRIGDYTPLHLAAQEANAPVARVLLEAGADPAAVTTNTGATPLHLAAKAIGGEGAVRTLLDAGVPVDPRESAAGQTPLMFAASQGRTAAVRELLSHGADPSIHTEIIDVLQRGAVAQAAQNRFREELGVERRRGDPFAVYSEQNSVQRGLSPEEVQAAVEAQREFLRSEEEIQKVLADFQGRATSSLHLTDEDVARLQEGGRTSGARFTLREETLVGKTGGMTALLHAAREGHIETVRALLNGGADIDQTSGDGSTPLVIGLLNGQFDLAMVLIDRGANPNLRTHTDGISPLFAVLQTQWAPMFTDHPQPRAHDTQEIEYMEVLNALLAAGADPNVRLNSHLWHWEYEGSPADAKLGIDLTGATPFWRAVFAQDIDAMKALAAHGADTNIPTAWPVRGMRGGRQQDGRFGEDSGLPIIPEGTPNMYPIHAAAGGGYLGVGAFRVNNVPNNFVEAVKYLVEEHEADVNLPDSWGYTPLHYAAVRGGNDLIHYLVSQGADVTATSRLGQSTADMARGGQGGSFSRTPYPDTVELLQSLGAPLLCLATHYRSTGDYCPGSGVEPWGAEEFEDR